jgi:hypothetical protein
MQLRIPLFNPIGDELTFHPIWLNPHFAAWLRGTPVACPRDENLSQGIPVSAVAFFRLSPQEHIVWKKCRTRITIQGKSRFDQRAQGSRVLCFLFVLGQP